MGEGKTAQFGQQTLIEEVARPPEIAPSYVFRGQRLLQLLQRRGLAPIRSQHIPDSSRATRPVAVLLRTGLAAEGQ